MREFSASGEAVPWKQGRRILPLGKLTFESLDNITQLQMKRKT